MNSKFKKFLSTIMILFIVSCYMPYVAFAEDKADISDAVIEAIVDQAYTGSEIKPPVIVKYNGNLLVSGTDYDVVYTSNINVGQAKITINGINKYTGNKSISFNIRKSIKNMKIEPLPTVAVGEKVKDFVIKDGNNVLIKDVDYTFDAPITVKGTNIVTIIGKGNYSGISETPDSVVFRYMGGESISANYEVVIPNQTLEYTGNRVTPYGVYVKQKSSNSILSSSYYTIGYTNNINAGTGSVVVQALFPYAGIIEQTFMINPRKLNYYCSVDPIDNVIQGDSAKVVVKDGSKELKQGVDYNVIDTQTGTGGTVTITGTGNYVGTITKQYKIASSLKNASVVLNNTSYKYDGSSKTPNVAVSFYNYSLVNGRDYKVVYKNNVNAGTATVEIIGINNYAGTIEKTFKIEPIDLSKATVSLSITNTPYTGKEIRPSVTVYYDGKYLSASDYSVYYWNNINIGTASVYVSAKYNDNLKATNTTGSIVKNFQIGGKYITSLAVTLSSDYYNYDGLAKRPTVSVKDGNASLIYGNDYIVEYKDNVNAGTAYVEITGKGTYLGTLTKAFTIKGYDQTVSTKFTRYTKYPTSNSFNLAASATGDGNGFTYRSSNESVVKVSPLGTVEIVGTGIATITVATTGTTKYDPASKTVTVTVKPNKAVISRAYSPASGKLKVAIKKAPGVTKYQVKYGRNGSYKNFYYKYSTNPNYMTQAKTFKGLDNGKAYFVKVRAYKTMDDGTKVWGNWSKTRKVYVR